MSEVKRYDFGIEIEGCYSQYAGEESPQGEYVKFTDFDRVTAERDALQQRLTVVDERADALDSVLRELLAGTGNSPGANRKYGHARSVLAGSQKQAAPEPYQGIPGTSFQRLNALANQGE